MSPKENIIPLPKTILDILQNILEGVEQVEQVEEAELPQPESDDDIELMSGLSDLSEEAYMEQIELLSDIDSDSELIYQNLIALEEMPSSSSDEETPTGRNTNGLVFNAARGEYCVRRQLFPSEASDSDSE